MAAPHPLARKRSKGYAPRIVAGGIDGSSSEEEARVEPDWRRLRKEDPVRFMALYKADYMHTMRRQIHGALQADYRHNVQWSKARATPPSVRK